MIQIGMGKIPVFNRFYIDSFVNGFVRNAFRDGDMEYEEDNVWYLGNILYVKAPKSSLKQLDI